MATRNLSTSLTRSRSVDSVRGRRSSSGQAPPSRRSSHASSERRASSASRHDHARRPSRGRRNSQTSVQQTSSRTSLRLDARNAHQASAADNVSHASRALSENGDARARIGGMLHNMDREAYNGYADIAGLREGVDRVGATQNTWARRIVVQISTCIDSVINKGRGGVSFLKAYKVYLGGFILQRGTQIHTLNRYMLLWLKTRYIHTEDCHHSRGPIIQFARVYDRHPSSHLLQ